MQPPAAQDSQKSSERLVRWIFGTLTLLFILFIVYASWTPADVKQSGKGLFGGITGFRDIFRSHNLRDIATNVLLYVPLGAFLALALSTSRRRFAIPALLVGSALSLTMEVGQSFIGRTPDVSDLITNSIGHVTGYLMILAAQRRGLNPLVFLGLDSNEAQANKTQTIAALRFITICIYVLVALYPFDVSVSFSSIHSQLLPDSTGVPKIILDPLYTISNWQDKGLRLTLEVWALLPIATLTAFIAGVRGRLTIFSPIFVCVLVALFCETAQIFIVSRRSDIALLFIAGISGLLGWLLARTWFKVQQIDARTGGTIEVHWQELALVLIGYALVIGLFAWSPFAFETDIPTVLRKIRYESNLVPFRQHFDMRNLATAVDILKEVGLFVPFGLLSARLFVELWPKLSRVQLAILVGLLSGSFATFTELSQALVVARFIDITDVFLGAFGGISGAVLMHLFALRRDHN